MKFKRLLSYLLSLTMVMSVLPTNISAYEEDADLFADDVIILNEPDPDKSWRTVYIHAQGTNPVVTPNVSTVYIGETANVYLAVDNPNKGEYDEDTGVHTEPHYDLNGYTVKIYFDPAFFNFEGDTSTPIDYTTPDENIDDSGADREEVGSGSDKEEVENTPQKPGYFPYRHGSTSAVIGGKTYKAAYATIFFSGSWLPNENEATDDEGNPIPAWYNIARLPLTPLKTGNTEVFIDVDGADEYTLELFAKNTTDEYAQTFLFDTINGGYHQITIKDKLKPSPPVPTPIAGKYTETKYITLEAEEGCEIYYKLGDAIAFERYIPNERIEVSRTIDIVTFAKRIADGKDSNQVTYSYQIVPKAPVLYDDDDTSIRIPNIYSEYTAYGVLVSENDPYTYIDDQNEIFYTFSDIEFDEALTVGGDDPSKEWVILPKQTQRIDITASETVRLYTRNMVTGEVSDIAVYYLSIKPDAVSSNYPSGQYNEKIDVELSTKTRGADIYYTTNQTDPRTNGILYDPDIPLTLYRDTTLRAVAYYDGQWGDVTSFYYIFDLYDDFGVDAFYPSGVYEGDVNVTLTPYNPDNTVEYSIDGGRTWEIFEGVINIDMDTEILARCINPEGETGEVYIFTYKIKPHAPEFAPESTQFTNSDKVTIYSPESSNETTSRFTLYYTIDGTDPITSKTRIKADEVSDSATIVINDYTVINAVVHKDGSSYSSVVTHSYDIVTKKPVKPITTLTPGNYTHEIGDTDGFSTKFLPIPEGTQIYYTVSYDGTFTEDPLPGEKGTYLYDGTDIEVKGHTIIKAVAVNVFGVKSDIGIFEYIITPESPVAAPSGAISGNKLPIVPVSAVVGSTVIYEIGEDDDKFENTFVATEESFYIDINTGMAYLDPDLTQRIGAENDGKIFSPAILHIKAELNDIVSDPNTYVYSLSESSSTLAPPFPDKETGLYEEIAVFADKGDEKTVLGIKLYSINYGDNIMYKLDSDTKWNTYESGDYVKLTGDSVLQLRAERDGKYSAVVSYVYNFKPLPPIITLPSGTYTTQHGLPSTFIELDPRAPEKMDYNIFYRRNGDPGDYRYMGTELEIEHTMSFKAYVINEDTERTSSNTIHYFIIEKENTSSGSVYIANPYDVSRIGADALSTGDYAKGIKLLSNNKDTDIQYFYTYTTVDGKSATTNNYIYDNAAPIFVNSSMEDITITAKLLDKEGNEIEGSERTFYIDFIHIETPVTNLYMTEPDKVEYARNTKIHLVNHYENDDSFLLYYTTDGSDPKNPDNKKRILYTSAEKDTLKLTGATTIKAVYYSTCDGNTETCIKCRNDSRGDCYNGIYGKVASFTYTVPKNSGGGGTVGGGGSVGGGSSIGGGITGGGNKVIDNTRKYTKDYFGFEHPTHISYIKGYPEGTVIADGNISREEMAVILYRVKNKQYDAPFTTTGSVFPDVGKDRWSVTEIEYMVNDKVITGYPEGDFRPEGKLTRAEFAALICRFTNLPAPTKENVFSDLSDTHWAYYSIMALYSAGFLNGYEDGTMRPEREITRAEVMKVMNIILGRKPLDTYVKSIVVNPFSDLTADKWYYVDVLEATITHDYFLNDIGQEYKWENIK